MISWKYKSGKSYVFIFVYAYEKDIGCPGRIELTLREKFPYSSLFWSAFSHIWTEYGEIRSVSLHSVQMRENADPNNSEYGHILRIVS